MKLVSMPHVRCIAGAKRIVLYGCGREALQIRGGAMRLYHLGLDIAMQTMARNTGSDASILPMGSLYEGAMFVLFETMMLKLRDGLGATPQAMRSRHTNLE